MELEEKIIPMEALPAWREALRLANKQLVVTNGCFDILHAGHVTYLSAARAQGDMLLVGLNSDTSVRKLKGEGRPIQTEADRATVLAALAAVDGVCIFSGKRATRFLELAQPNVYVKGGDYTVTELPAKERAEVQRHGGRIVVLDLVPGQSSSRLVELIAEL